MGGYGNTPNFNGYVGLAFGSWSDGGCVPVVAPIGFVFGANPPYYLDDLAVMFPKFFGPGAIITGAAISAGSNNVTVPSIAGLAIGQFVRIAGVPAGSVITDLASGQITVSNLATDTATNIAITVYQAPPIPIAVIQIYINLATASIIFNRWQEQWKIAMGWFIAHYCTLYARSDAETIITYLQTLIHSETPAGDVPGTDYTLSEAPPSGVLDGLFVNGLYQKKDVDYTLEATVITMSVATSSNATIVATWQKQQTVQINSAGAMTSAEIAASGLMNGILTSKSVGDASASYSILSDQEGWGQFRTTVYGAMLIDMARVVGSGPALFV